MRRGLFATALVAILATACGGSAGTPAANGSAAAAPQNTATATPVEHHAVRFAFSAATPQVSKVPSILALEALKQEGHDVTILYLQSSEDPVQAVVRGDANFGSASASTVFAAIAQGIPVKAIMVANTPDYVMVAPASVTSPSQLGGLKVGIHAAVSSTALYTNVMLEKFPGVKPNILVVPGSANRVQALAAGQLDGSVVQLSDLPALEKLAPGKFHAIFDVAKERPDLMDAVIFTRAELLRSDPNLVQQYIVAQLKANRNAYADQKGLAAAIAKYVPNTTADLGAQFAKFYTDSGIWPKDGGMNGANVSATLSALTSSKLIAKAPTAAECCDRSALDAALKTIGN
ncbi:MAG TPA: ABC transporter substrate-binding protein [Candidatus Limnocylindria bacterium]|nr:ABC transporter substrate-binding protein [Candidatus Limnocylindria bacterium]